MEVYILLLGILGASVYYDFRFHRIPNVLSLGGSIIGIALAAAGSSLDITLDDALLGGILGLVLFMPFHVAGKMGAGDVKLLAMSGTFLGPFGVLYASVFTLIAGAVLAILWMMSCLVKESMAKRVADACLVEIGDTRSSDPGSSSAPDGQLISRSQRLMTSKVPYATAIAIGTLAAASM